MKISVDTAHDSPDEIRKVINMLRHLVGDLEIASSVSKQSSPDVSEESSAAFSNMFDDTPSVEQVPSEPPNPEQIPAQQTEPQQATTGDHSTNSLFNELFEDEPPKKEDDEGDSKVKLY